MTLSRRDALRLAAALPLALAAPAARAATPRKLVLIAGKPSHPPRMHEFRAGSILLTRALKGVPGLTVDTHFNGWVSDEATLNDADAVVIFSDGGGGHPALQGDHLKTLGVTVHRVRNGRALPRRGAGVT